MALHIAVLILMVLNESRHDTAILCFLRQFWALKYFVEGKNTNKIRSIIL